MILWAHLIDAKQRKAQGQSCVWKHAPCLCHRMIVHVFKNSWKFMFYEQYDIWRCYSLLVKIFLLGLWCLKTWMRMTIQTTRAKVRGRLRIHMNGKCICEYFTFKRSMHMKSWIKLHFWSLWISKYLTWLHFIWLLCDNNEMLKSIDSYASSNINF